MTAEAKRVADLCCAVLKTAAKPTLPVVRDLVRLYYALPGNGAGGSLHIVLDDNNVERRFIWFCHKYACKHGDTAGANLAAVLLRLSNSQLRKL